MIRGLFQNGALPVLDRVVQFTEARQAVLADSVANLSTPYHRPRDLDPAAFQAELRRGIDARRRDPGPRDAPLKLRNPRDLTFRPDRLHANARPADENLLFHDQNNRDLERTMQKVAENQLAHNAAVRLLGNQFDLLESAIRETV